MPTPQQHQHQHQQQQEQQPDTKPVLGVVGVGKMGAAMAANFLRAGVAKEVVVYDRYDRRSVWALAKEGAVAAGSLEEVGSRCATVMSMLPNDDALTRCVARRVLIRPADLPFACTETNHFHSTHIRTHTYTHSVTRQLLPALQPGALHISCSTVSPFTSRMLARTHAARGVAFVGAPVFARPDGVARRQAYFTVGATDAGAIERARCVGCVVCYACEV